MQPIQAADYNIVFNTSGYEYFNTHIKEGEYTDTIQIGNNYLLLKIDQIKINKIKINKQQELQKLIQFETNKQLNQFSRIYFNKSKINYSINEK